jgi:hypothetical protein
MSYLTLKEAGEYLRRKTGIEIDEAALFRAGVGGVLLIAAPFSSVMRNCTAHTNENFAGLLVISPLHLLEIETSGQTKILGAISLDGKTAYAPNVIRTHEQLRVLVSEQVWLGPKVPLNPPFGKKASLQVSHKCL